MKSKNSKVSLPKDDFIDYLSSLTPEEINEYIKQKGKKAKLVSPFIVERKTDQMDKS